MESNRVAAPASGSKRDHSTDENEAEKAAILTVLRSETEAWLNRDFEALASHWVQSPTARRMEHYASIGVRVDEGWTAIAARLKAIMERFPTRGVSSEPVRQESINVVVGTDMAWVTYSQIGIAGGEDRKRELKILHKMEDAWRISCVAIMEGAVEQANYPLIEVDADARVLWMNWLAKERIREHQGFSIAAGRLRTLRREYGPVFREAVRRAFRELRGQSRLAVSQKQAWAVPLGEDQPGVRMYCWIHLEDGKALVSFDDEATVARRIAPAREIYGLSPAQMKLARLIVDGHDLARAAEILDVSINTVRTQLQRIYDKTGARSQDVLVRSLLSIDTP